MNIYNICNIVFRQDKYKNKDILWKKFEVYKQDVQCEAFQITELKKRGVFHAYEIYNKVQGNIVKLYNDLFLVSEDYKYGWFLDSSNQNNRTWLVLYLFYTHAVQRHMIQLHSSLIATTDNRGLMFLGPSGIGKTTQAELWHKYRDALIINGDIVFVQETENAFLGWGTPWHGSSPYCENTNVPVEALIVLKQAPENSIRELTGFEKVSEVSNSVFYPRWLENGMELCLETLDHLLSKLPVYELRCRPDEDAVRMTEETIFKN